MASLPHCLPTNNETLHVGMAIYADDVAMWCEGPSENLRFGGLWSDVVIYYESYDISRPFVGSATTYTPTTLQRSYNFEAFVLPATPEHRKGPVARSITFERPEEAYGDWIHVYTDASVNAVKKTATVAITIPEMDFEVSGRLSFETSSTTAELVAIWAALESIKNITPPTKAVVLTDSRGALQQLKRLERATPLLNRVALTAATVEDLGWSLALQWIPSHVGIPGNERTDELAARAHNDGDPTFLLDRFNEAHRLIRDTIRTKHPHTGVATGRPPPSIPRKLPRSEASLLHRLRTGCPHTAKRLHMYRRKTDPGCPTFGLPHSTAKELLNPSGTRGIVEKAFRALLQYLRDCELSDRL
ncbi:hypothetical protein HPB47_002837 [Ixodes persulcatus]|uniref:Uncharacterized protein n=1 Tax=Ixodes persulcatus TaxID=34615 RepID=A0AC60PLS7_IXOPE|nr:hypothetical protein HPB47_002837 [Ixodes persulcatus]